ncbi:MAG: M48 family metallopeptidase [Bacteroidota bacterium]
MNAKTSIPALLILTFVVISCAKVPFTGRRQLKMVPIGTINSMSFQQYDEFLKGSRVLTSGKEVNTVRAVGNKLIRAVNVYYKANNLADQLPEFDWEFNVVKNDTTVNAFCMPGGKVVVYTGILKITQDEDGLAVVMGHEIAHALAHHGNERMTQTMGLNGALTGIDTYLAYRAGTSETAQEAAQRERTRQVMMAAAGMGAQVGIILPYSRKHESEADKIGLYLMAIAGYDVDAAAPFWSRMAAKGGQLPPEFLSTHPHPDTRQTNLKEWAAEAKEMGNKYSIN